jgi:hypothetical protein
MEVSNNIKVRENLLLPSLQTLTKVNLVDNTNISNRKLFLNGGFKVNIKVKLEKTCCLQTQAKN